MENPPAAVVATAEEEAEVMAAVAATAEEEVTAVAGIINFF